MDNACEGIIFAPMFTQYEDVLQYLYANLPMFQRVGSVAFKSDLSNTIALCEALDNPQRKFKSIHIAGTNGKGSTSHMLASVLQSAGYKTGLYTSPHLKSFTERIRVNGKEVSEQFVVDFVNRIQPVIERVKPSFFEITVAMAFDYFVHEQVDVAVIEVGLGGRLDSTNVITPELSLITNIGWDHTDLLGDTLEKIAAEKAGIIKKNVPVVVSEQQPGIADVFRSKAAAETAPLRFASDVYTVQFREEKGTILFDALKNGKPAHTGIALPLQGIYQQKNLAGVLCAIDVLRQQGWKITDEQLVDGLMKVMSQTGLKGRWQKLGTNPLIVCDTGHNLDGVTQVVKQLQQLSYKRLFMVIGMVKDKDISGVLELLPKEANYYFCQASIPRALEAGILAEKARSTGLKGEVIANVNEAIQRARAKASAEDVIFIGGSTFVVAEIDGL
ncbi:bifunctional folylpolyglutamate synthase/dihydrofolate synthase [Ohtaekwangia kribbensis]|jgi:dihydrofolate synthase/folylpolyglutamate synthase|uniref:Dihydrofolate synthase/folylpolyglutamate synthase n=1 Tax=Ohtaekwangia kribbensis TaxID=688913 RepID=A0ABW3KC95_9BACT